MRKKPRNTEDTFFDTRSFVDCLVSLGCCSMVAVYETLYGISTRSDLYKQFLSVVVLQIMVDSIQLLLQ